MVIIMAIKNFFKEKAMTFKEQSHLYVFHYQLIIKNTDLVVFVTLLESWCFIPVKCFVLARNVLAVEFIQNSVVGLRPVIEAPVVMVCIVTALSQLTLLVTCTMCRVQ